MTKKSNTINVSLHGVNLNRIYRSCKDENIEIFNINRKDYKNIEFDIFSKNKKKIEKIAKKNNFKLSINNIYGTRKIFQFLFSRFGILIGIFIFFSINFVSSFFVWDIKIYGNEFVQNQEILSILGQKNIKIGSISATISPNEVEDIITNNVEKVSMCSVIKKGTTLIINIKEKVLASEIKNINGNVDITANTNLTITELEVLSGTPLKKVGDSVKAGDVIVAGYILDTNGNKISCNANAKIKAKTWHSATEIYYKTAEIEVRTGNEVQSSKLEFFGAIFPVKTEQNNFECFSEEITEKYITNNFIPIKMVTTTFYETKIQTIEQNFEEDKQSVLDRCQKLAYKDIREDEIVSKIFDVVTEEEDRYIVTSYVEVIFEF